MTERGGQREIRMFRRPLITLEGWRDTKAGMWAWLLVRISAVLIVLLLAAHLVYPYAVSVQFMLLLCLTFHAVLGLRVIMMDLGVAVKFQKPLFAALSLLGLAIFLLIWWGRL